MRKTFIYIVLFVIIIISVFVAKYYEYKQNKRNVDQYNVKYLQYIDKEIYGIDIATLINKAVDNNERTFVKKNEKGKYIQNDENSINIEIKINDEEEGKIYSMETLYGGGMEQFVEYYELIKFKSCKIEYNSIGKIKYILFEQISS